jgi:hypothetical protein
MAEEAKATKRAVFFVDAAHSFSSISGMPWCSARQFICAPAGRQRFNMLGALNAMMHELMVTNDTYINANSVCNLLRRITALGIDGSNYFDPG